MLPAKQAALYWTVLSGDSIDVAVAIHIDRVGALRDGKHARVKAVALALAHVLLPLLPLPQLLLLLLLLVLLNAAEAARSSCSRPSARTELAARTAKRRSAASDRRFVGS